MDNRLPATVTFVRATPTEGSCGVAPGDVFCELGSLAKGSSAAVTIVVTPLRAGTITNTATVDSSTKDPNLANNAAAVTTTVVTLGNLLRRSLADRDTLGLSLEGFEPIGPLASKL
jgi:hypothetical protein